MTDAWDGRPSNPERTGPHELWNLPEHGGLGPTYWTWDADVQCWTLGFYMKHPDDACRVWRYVGPCALPADLAALLAAVREKALREAAEVADRGRMLPGDCEHLGPTDWETGVRKCALEMRDEICPCWERADEAEKVHAAILALIPPPKEDSTDG